MRPWMIRPAPSLSSPSQKVITPVSVIHSHSSDLGVVQMRPDNWHVSRYIFRVMITVNKPKRSYTNDMKSNEITGFTHGYFYNSFQNIANMPCFHAIHEQQGPFSFNFPNDPAFMPVATEWCKLDTYSWHHLFVAGTLNRFNSTQCSLCLHVGKCMKGLSKTRLFYARG